eukprot:6665771-Ditylum_brightwellii.AAC.1
MGLNFCHPEVMLLQVALEISCWVANICCIRLKPRKSVLEQNLVKQEVLRYKGGLGLVTGGDMKRKI